MKDMEDDDEDGSDKSSEEESEEGSDKEVGDSLSVYDEKLSHNTYKFDKKTKIFTCTTGWYTATAKKPTDKFTVELMTNAGSYMVGFINKISYNQNAANYSTGHYWYCNSGGLYGQGQMLTFNSNAGSNQGTKIGCLFMRKKLIISYYKDGKKIGDAWKLTDKKKLN